MMKKRKNKPKITLEVFGTESCPLRIEGLTDHHLEAHSQALALPRSNLVTGPKALGAEMTCLLQTEDRPDHLWEIDLSKAEVQ